MYREEEQMTRNAEAGLDPETLAPDVVLLASGLALGRLAIGAGLMIAPELTLKTLGFEKPSASTLAVARLAGGRDLVLGAAETAALVKGDRTALLASTIAVAAADAGDTAIFGAAWGSGEKSVREASMKGTVSAGLATASALWVAWRLRSRAR
jgi:hypothetical protein